MNTSRLLHRVILLTLTSLLVSDTHLQSQSLNHHVQISKDLEIIPLSEHTYVSVSYAQVAGWGRVGSNGMIFLENHDALLFDSPPNDSLTEQLVRWMSDSLHVRIRAFVATHWHDDRMGGLGYIHAIGIPSYAQEKTRSISRSKKLPVPQTGFTDSLVLHLDRDSVVCRYFGAGHTPDNIVIWIPADRVLFGGCMVKELRSEGLGNIADAVLDEWPGTISKVIQAYPEAVKVVPGHGALGGRELLFHTFELLSNSTRSGRQ